MSRYYYIINLRIHIHLVINLHIQNHLLQTIKCNQSKSWFVYCIPLIRWSSLWRQGSLHQLSLLKIASAFSFEVGFSLRLSIHLQRTEPHENKYFYLELFISKFKINQIKENIKNISHEIVVYLCSKELGSLQVC